MIQAQSQSGRGAVSRQMLFPSLLLLILTGCDWRGPQTLPEQVLGEWKTDDARYQGRFVKVEADQITFGLGGAAPDELEHIERVHMVPTDNRIDYAIKLKKPNGASDSIALLFTPERGGELRLKNQPKVVWSRRKDPVQPQPVKSPRPAALPFDVVLGEHKTIYKIDCIRPKVCHSTRSALECTGRPAIGWVWPLRPKRRTSHMTARRRCTRRRSRPPRSSRSYSTVFGTRSSLAWARAAATFRR